MIGLTSSLNIERAAASAVLGDPDVLGAKLGVTLDEVEAYLTRGGDDA
jgi:hypothetical protein